MAAVAAQPTAMSVIAGMAWLMKDLAVKAKEEEKEEMAETEEAQTLQLATGEAVITGLLGEAQGPDMQILVMKRSLIRAHQLM